MPPMRARTLLPFIALLGAVRLSAQQPAARQPSAYEELLTFSAVLTTPTSAPPRTISAGSRSF